MVIPSAQRRAGKEGACGRCVQWRRLSGLVPVQRAGRGAEDQEPGGLREEPHDLAGPADRLQLLGKGHRRKGVATAALAGALDLIARLGGGMVEGYPEDAGSVPAGFLFHGALATYEKLGFVRDRKIGKNRWVVTKVVEPTS